MPAKKPQIVVIDTCKLLTIYDLSDEFIENLNNLLGRIKKGQIRLVLPEQIIEEVERQKLEDRYNKELVRTQNKINHTNENIKLIENMKLGETAQKYAIKSLKKKIKEQEKLKKRLWVIYLSPRSNPNKLIKKLFKLAEKLPTTEEIMRAVEIRKMKRNYPREKDGNKKDVNKVDEKDGHYGDAIIWETLLASDIKGDVTFISHDSGWKTTTGEFEFNRVLQAEWKRKTSGKVELVKEIADITSLKPKEKEELKQAEEKIYSHDTSSQLVSSFVVGHPSQAVFTRNNDFNRILVSEAGLHSSCLAGPILVSGSVDQNSILLADNLPDEYKMPCVYCGNPLPITSLSNVCSDCSSRRTISL